MSLVPRPSSGRTVASSSILVVPLDLTEVCPWRYAIHAVFQQFFLENLAAGTGDFSFQNGMDLWVAEACEFHVNLELEPWILKPSL
jgi:hypothetical protein